MFVPQYGRVPEVEEPQGALRICTHSGSCVHAHGLQEDGSGLITALGTLKCRCELCRCVKDKIRKLLRRYHELAHATIKQIMAWPGEPICLPPELMDEESDVQWLLGI